MEKVEPKLIHVFLCWVNTGSCWGLEFFVGLVVFVLHIGDGNCLMKEYGSGGVIGEAERCFIGFF